MQNIQLIIIAGASGGGDWIFAAAPQYVTADDPHSICSIMPVDHVVENPQIFANAAKATAETAAFEFFLYAARPSATAEHGNVRSDKKLSGAFHSKIVTLNTGGTYAGARPYRVKAAVNGRRAAADEAVAGAAFDEIINSPNVVVVASSANVVNIVRNVREKRSIQRKAAVVRRSWGSFESINSGPMYKIKLLHMNASTRLKTKRHYGRSKHWVVLQGVARVTVEKDEHFVSKDQAIYIPPFSWHELENPGRLPLWLVEVQLGPYLGEDNVSCRDEPITRRGEE